MKTDRETRKEEMKVANMMHYLRTMFEQRNAIDLTAQQIAEKEIGVTNPRIYITVEDVSLDDDADHPTISIQARESWQGDYKQHTYVLPLEDFALAYAENGGWQVTDDLDKNHT